MERRRLAGKAKAQGEEGSSKKRMTMRTGRCCGDKRSSHAHPSSRFLCCLIRTLRTFHQTCDRRAEAHHTEIHFKLVVGSKSPSPLQRSTQKEREREFGRKTGRDAEEGMAATLLSGALSFHVGAQSSHLDVDSSGAIASPRMRPLGLASSSCLPLFTQQTRALLLQPSGNRARSVRVASFKDSQREVVREPSKPVELDSPPAPSGKDGSHSSESPQEAADFLAARAEDEGVSLKEEVDEEGVSGTVKGTVIATVLLLGFVGAFGALGVVYKDQINDLLTQFSDFLEGYGPAGYALFVLAYAGLEVLAIPAVPLTMSAGLLFGTLYGTILVSISGTLAATVAFLIARYFARDRILKLAQNNPKFLAIDKAIGADGFRVVTLLRLSPLLPFSLGNYLYGLTSVELGPYVLGSWLGMLPGTWAYVSAGAIGRAFIKQESEAAFPTGPESYWTLGLGLVATVFAASYVGKLAKDAMKDIEDA